jgi:serine/threonine protein kinase
MRADTVVRTCRRNGYEVVRTLGQGHFGRVLMARCAGTEGAPDTLHALKVVPLSRVRSWTWMTEDEWEEAVAHHRQITDFVSFSLPPGIAQEEMVKACDVLASRINTVKHAQLPALGGDEFVPLVRRDISEREILSRLKEHPFVVGLQDTFEDDEFSYMAMEYLPHGTLRRIMPPGERLRIGAARFYAAELLELLAFMGGSESEHHVAHRDLKPENILLRESGHIALADFGLSTRLRANLHTFCGTPEYIAPEMLLGKSWDAAPIDLYALGATLYEMLVGRTPHAAAGETEAGEIFMACMSDDVTYPADMEPAARELISALLTKNPAERLTAKEAKEAPFFDGVEWETLTRCEHLVPYVPPPVVDDDADAGGGDGAAAPGGLSPLERRDSWFRNV